MFVSRLMSTQWVFCLTELVALLTVVSTTAYMFQLYVVPHVGCVLAGVVTLHTLPHAIGVLPHLGLNQTWQVATKSVQELFIKCDIILVLLKRNYRLGITILIVLMLVSCPVDAESILSSAKLTALLAVVASGEHMLGLNVVPHIGWLLAGVITIQM